MEIKHIPRETFLNMQRNSGVGGGGGSYYHLFSFFLWVLQMEQLVKMVGRFFVCIYKLKSDSLQLNIIRRVFSFFFSILPFFISFFIKETQRK